MPSAAYPFWTLLSFPTLVVAIAVLPMTLPERWERRAFQIAVVASCTIPVIIFELATSRGSKLWEGLRGYLAFLVTLGALFTTAGGVQLEGDIEATPRNNVLFLLVGACLASVIGTTGASMLLIRPLLRTNRQRKHRAHLVPFFILIVANAGGLLSPLGDPPLLVGYIQGVPFFWTLRLFPIWALYVASLLASFYVVERRAQAREEPAAKAANRAELKALSLLGRRNLLLLLAIVPAALLPEGFREVVLLVIALTSFFSTPSGVHEANTFSFGPILDIAIIFSGVFLCLGPIEASLAEAAPHFSLQSAWQLFWGSGVLSAVLDNAPTYTAFAALARGLTRHSAALVAGIDPLRLAAISAGSVVMGATTYIGNGPNLMVKAMAEAERYEVPSFFRYFMFAFTTMLPAHLIVTAALFLLER